MKNDLLNPDNWLNPDDVTSRAIGKDVPYPGRPYAHETEVLYFCSERQKDGRLLSKADAAKVDAMPESEFWCVCGGLMLLELLIDIEARPITLIDSSVKQLMYAEQVIECIKQNNNYIDFLRNVDSYHVASVDQWINLVFGGRWESHYGRIRNALNVSFYYGPLGSSPIPGGSIVYTSTVHPMLYANLKDHHIIEAYTVRDVPQWKS